jgi:hypothetical protein
MRPSNGKKIQMKKWNRHGYVGAKSKSLTCILKRREKMSIIE